MATEADALRARVKAFAVRILKFVRTFPTDPAGITVARQLARAGTGVSANYHGAGRSRSRAEFISRLAIVVEEADESEHWLSVSKQTGLSSGPELESLWQESRELRAIFSKALSTARKNGGRTSLRP
jgi:four helix bundle protein